MLIIQKYRPEIFQCLMSRYTATKARSNTSDRNLTKNRKFGKNIWSISDFLNYGDVIGLILQNNENSKHLYRKTIKTKELVIFAVCWKLWRLRGLSKTNAKFHKFWFLNCKYIEVVTKKFIAREFYRCSSDTKIKECSDNRLFWAAKNLGSTAKNSGGFAVSVKLVRNFISFDFWTFNI